jgi:oxepin-CoA hydrolase/3-oxo-5,6-dehydrosuberyl-CoA semialdehyde dehydrogenase
MKTNSYVYGQWIDGMGTPAEVKHALSGEVISHVDSTGIDFAKVVEHSKQVAGPTLRNMTLHERADALKALGLYLIERKAHYYEISHKSGATKVDGWVDIEGGIGTMLSYSSMVRRELPNETFIVEGDVEALSKNGTFVGQHILTAKPGLSLHINAFNFPCWGMLEKIAPSILAGVPVIVKPATVTAYLTHAMVQDIIASGLLPEGSLQLICGATGNLLEQLDEQDVVTFTGSAVTGKMLKQHPNIVEKNIPFNMEADSLNCSILGETVTEDSPEFDLFIKEVAREMTMKAGQKCTAIRRTIVPSNKIEAVQAALIARLQKVTIGDPSIEGVRMGALVGLKQRDDVRSQVAKLAQTCDVVFGGNDAKFEVIGADATVGAFYPPTLLRCNSPLTQVGPHEIEAFGPVTTLMPYASIDEAIMIAKLGKGSLVASVVSFDPVEIKNLVLNAAAFHGRMLVLNRDCAKESTGHGSPLAALVHGGPGRAGGGEELGGLRAIKHYMQRTAIQGSPSTLMAITNEYVKGAKTVSYDKHPFRKYFEDLSIGESLTTHKRTVTEADIVNFGCLSGDHFYAHFDETAVKDSFFGKRVAHGYFIISAAAGMFVDPAKGPVIANYGLENLRFIEPVGIGDTIQVTITVKRKIKKAKRPDDLTATGVVVWNVEVCNQREELVALYDILTLVERQEP